METVEHDVTAPGTLVLDRYSLVEELGSGGFGAVWLARDERLERPVAVKRIPVTGAAAAARAEKEALAAARLSHPAVVSLFEAGRDERAVYLVSELVRGHTLGDLLAEGALSDRDVVLVGMAMCDALGHAHERGVIHRDVKPGNVLIPEVAGEGVVAKLTDFGIARISGDDALTVTGDVVGTLAYMAPEQAEGRGATAASDLYSLGLVVYEALSGANPVRGANAAATARNVGMRLPPLRRLRRDLPRGLCAAVDATVLADPALRGSPASLRLALADALPHVGDEPGTVEAPAWAVEPAPRAGKRVRGTDFPAQPWREKIRSAPPPTPGEPLEDVPPRRPHVTIPARLASAAVTAGAVAAALTLVEATPPLEAPAAAALAAVLVALLPRIGWLVSAALLVAWLAAQPGHAWWVVGLAALPLPLLVPHRPAWWSAPALAVALSYATVPAAWPAVAGQARGPWARAVLGAAGFWTLSLLGVLRQERLVLDPVGDLEELVTSPSLAVAGVWAAAAVLLPLVVRGRNAGVDLLGALAWAGALAVGTQAAADATGAGDASGLVGAAAVAAVLAVLARALRRS